MLSLRWLNRFHGAHVHSRRTRILTAHVAPLLPNGARVLDIGCGDGLISHLIMQRRPDVTIEGIDVLARPGAHIPVRKFDGGAVPQEDGSFDVVLLLDVLHHTEDPMVLLAEAARVSRGYVILKDHRVSGAFAGPTLRFMDWVGNAHHDVVLPYNYWRPEQWAVSFAKLGLDPEFSTTEVGLYPAPASWIFGRKLHFIAQLRVKGPGGEADRRSDGQEFVPSALM